MRSCLVFLSYLLVGILLFHLLIQYVSISNYYGLFVGSISFPLLKLTCSKLSINAFNPLN